MHTYFGNKKPWKIFQEIDKTLFNCYAMYFICDSCATGCIFMRSLHIFFGVCVVFVVASDWNLMFITGQKLFPMKIIRNNVLVKVSHSAIWFLCVCVRWCNAKLYEIYFASRVQRYSIFVGPNEWRKKGANTNRKRLLSCVVYTTAYIHIYELLLNGLV